MKILDVMEKETPDISGLAAKPAGFGFRFIAFLIDAALIICLAWLIWGSDVVSTSGGTTLSVDMNNEQLLLPLLYWLFFWVLFSTTPGMILTGLKITAENGGKIGTVRSLIRLAGFVVLPVGVWLIFAGRKKQALHDLLADTYVTRKPLSA